jgi:acetyl/propionyl-CoA carboxylase alpha subunit/acetyl-CoA carboxylase carboxyltransferase component
MEGLEVEVREAGYRHSAAPRASIPACDRAASGAARAILGALRARGPPPMPLSRLLVVNRGEIAIRVLAAAAELRIETLAVASEDDARSPHLRHADRAVILRGVGPAAYLDVEQILARAAEHGCDAVHPGYGFLAERPDFARRCREKGLVFVGPSPEALALLGDKLEARALAVRCGVPVLPATAGTVTLEAARAFLAAQPAGAAIALKAVAGGGGRGLRAVRRPEDLEAAFARCTSEAQAAFGDGALYAERWLPRARHVEVQLLGDGAGAVAHLYTRECTLQRRHQKLVEIAPCPGLPEALRERLQAAAVEMGRAARCTNSATIEFLIDAASGSRVADFFFLEANPRLQVEHTVTEEVTGVDLVQAQLRLAGGETLAALELSQDRIPTPRGFAVQVRIHAEVTGSDGGVKPAAGVVTLFEPPSGPGLRVDACAAAGSAPNPRFDPLLAKLIAHAPRGVFADALRKAARALGDLRVEGVATNAPLLRSLLEHPDVAACRATTGFVDERIGELLSLAAGTDPAHASVRAGALVDAIDPLAVLEYGRSGARPAPPPLPPDLPEGRVAVRAPLQGTVVSLLVSAGDLVPEAAALVVMEAMKMEHVIRAEASGRVERILAAPGDTLYEGHPLLLLEPCEVAAPAGGEDALALDALRPDLDEVRQRHALGMDAARPDMVERRRRTGQRTTRENVDDLCDPGSFVEYGPLAIAAQRRRRPLEDLIRRTPADGLVAGIGTVNADRFGEERARCMVLSYDYTVLAGTQGLQNHRKKDRMFEIAERQRLPIVFFTEGGGGRPGDTDGSGVAGLDCLAFALFGGLSGLVPLVGISSGRCFAGNAALLGCCDVVIATADSTIGMGGPAMIEGGGLGVFRPEEVGPLSVQVPNGVVDVAVADEAEAVRVARRYLSYFQGALDRWECADPRRLRGLVPENRLRVYDVRRVVETLADTDSVLELRRGFGAGMVTALARVEGRPLGVVANNPAHLGGAIDSDGADKAARFLQLCDAFDLPVLFLCDTPGIMVGPEAEKTALVRKACRLFVTGASLSVPYFTIVLRKMYGLGGQAMAGGSTRSPLFTVAWPTGEFGGMGLEGSVKLGFRKELLAVEDPAARKRLFDEMVARAYAHGKALNTASHFEIDDVIDPADSRRWIARALASSPPPPRREGKKRPCIDTW